MSEPTDHDILERIHEGFRRVGLAFPYLTGLIQQVRVQLDRRVQTMGVFASGRLVANPDFVRTLSAPDLQFVLTHELYHLMLRTHRAAEGTDPLQFNFAHDYIINDILREELQHKTIPAGGLDWPGARHLSAEKILGEMERNPNRQPSQSWNNQPSGGLGGDKAAGEGPPGDVLDGRLERQWFPGESAGDQEARGREVQECAGRAMSLRALMESMRGRGTEAGERHEKVAALRGLYRPPWELALQRWLEAVAPSERTYARPSRRGADRTDVVLPGHKREGWTLHIVLDTSGSMASEIPTALGAIADFCEAVGVDRTHLIQCDTAVGSDEWLTPPEMAEWEVTGYGGSDLGPAMTRLAEDAEVTAAIVLTDGDIEYPEHGMPYSVLWVLPASKSPEEFQPRYGKVIAMTRN